VIWYVRTFDRWALGKVQRFPLPSEQPIHPRIRHFTIDDAVFPQRSFTHKAELFKYAARCAVARIGLGLNTIQVKSVEAPLQQGTCGLRGKALTPGRVIEAVADPCAPVVRVPFDQAAPADEHAVSC